ncbi:MAG: hydroxysqualene dehydroxylase HpnE [Planctomycetota bacterium]|nr:hydroxysqualene dehydroxylase HpnE [Planctomycetota bacterium]
MKLTLSESYRNCEKIAIQSGSSFYRSFALLRADRRQAMTALYAFARLADNATDGEGSIAPNSNDWSAAAWHQWLDVLCRGDAGCHDSTRSLEPIRLALSDSVNRFSIPLDTLHDIIRGVDSDIAISSDHSTTECEFAHPISQPIRMKSWEETSKYCHRVASSVGLACLSIWSETIGRTPCSGSIKAALDCGVAFQMTNILRDIVEDSGRNRIYLPEDEFARFEIDSTKWLSLNKEPTTFALNELGDWRGLIRLQIERTKAMYDRGWQVANSISLDGQRMFSLMWHSYREILLAIEKRPERIWQERIGLSKGQKLQLAGQHWFTPLFTALMESKRNALVGDSRNALSVWPTDGPRVAVIGAGLAGIQSAMHLSRHGCRVTLLESKHRIGGRVGSFHDSESDKSIDYCQHVGMNCCSTLKQWIKDTDQEPFWTEQDSLYFVGANGERIRVSAWPLPAPFHLSGLLFRWPQLGILDRLRVGVGLLKLKRLKRDGAMASQLAIAWLRANGQNDRCIQNFWSTILVSALGEQIDRVTLEATHKVLIDGFALTRNGFHLLVPNRPLSELLDYHVAHHLKLSGVEVRLGSIVKGIQRDSTGSYLVRLQGAKEKEAASESYDAVVIALPWHKVADILPEDIQPKVRTIDALQSSPITGVHTWWDRPWLKEPHAILIDRLSQWVFPAPQSSDLANSDHVATKTREYYYQVVISASRNLPTGDSESILSMVKQDLSEIFPEASVATMLRGRVVTDPNAVFSVSVGHESSRLKSDLLSAEKIWLAGDWTDTKWPATMEGSLRSGAFASQELLGAFGRSVLLSE